MGACNDICLAGLGIGVFHNLIIQCLLESACEEEESNAALHYSVLKQLIATAEIQILEPFCLPKDL